MEIQRHYDNVLEALKIFENDSLVAPPGTKFSYSSYGFNLLSAVIESASGEPFLAYMQEHVFTPVGLVHTTADQNTLIVEERSRFYELAKTGATENAPYVDNSYKWAGGGFLSTAEDLVRFGSAMLQPGLLNADSLKRCSRRKKPKAARPSSMELAGSFANRIRPIDLRAFRRLDRRNFASASVSRFRGGDRAGDQSHRCTVETR